MANGDSNISNNLIEAIADSTAISVGEQPAILSNLALANLIANTNLAQQNAISNQQAMFQLEMTIVSKCVEVIASISPSSQNPMQQLSAMQQLLETIKQMQATNVASTGAAAPQPAAPTAAAAKKSSTKNGASRRSRAAAKKGASK